MRVALVNTTSFLPAIDTMLGNVRIICSKVVNFDFIDETVVPLATPILKLAPDSFICEHRLMLLKSGFEGIIYIQ